MSILILTLDKHIGLESRTQLNFNFIFFLCFEAKPIITWLKPKHFTHTPAGFESSSVLC